MALPLNCGHKISDQVVTLQVLRRFEFDPALMRSGVVAVDCDDPDTGLVFVRGAPSVVEQLVRRGHVPADYRQASLCLLHHEWLCLNVQQQCISLQVLFCLQPGTLASVLETLTGGQTAHLNGKGFAGSH